MSGFTRFQWSSTVLLSCALISVPGPLPAQTTQEIARQQELSQRIKEQELRQREMEQALWMRAKEQEVRQMQLEQALRLSFEEQEFRQQQMQQVQEARQADLAKIQEAMLQARMQEGAAAAQATAQFEEARRLFAEASAAGRERSQERDARLREIEERYREYQARLRDQSDEMRARTLEAIQRAEQEARRVQEIVVQMQQRIRLGVSLNAGQGEEYDLQGVLVAEVIKDSPAEEIGLVEGDVITHLGGHSLLEPIPDEAEQDFDLNSSIPVQRLQALVGELDPGDEMDIRYLRDGQARTATFTAADVDPPDSPVVSWITRGEGPSYRRILRVGPDSAMTWTYSSPDSTMRWLFSTPEEGFIFRGGDSLEGKWLEELRELGELKELEGLKELRLRVPELEFETLGPEFRGAYMFEEGEGPRAFTIQMGAGRYGLELADLNPALGEYFSTDDGVLVLNVDEDSDLGLRPGDVILSIDGRAVEDRGDVGRILASYEDDEIVTFRVMRAGSETQIEGKVR